MIEKFSERLKEVVTAALQEGSCNMPHDEDLERLCTTLATGPMQSLRTPCLFCTLYRMGYEEGYNAAKMADQLKGIE